MENYKLPRRVERKKNEAVWSRFFLEKPLEIFFSKRSWWYFVDGVSRAECRMLIYSSLIKANVDGMSRAFL